MGDGRGTSEPGALHLLFQEIQLFNMGFKITWELNSRGSSSGMHSNSSSFFFLLSLRAQLTSSTKSHSSTLAFPIPVNPSMLSSIQSFPLLKTDRGSEETEVKVRSKASKAWGGAEFLIEWVWESDDGRSVKSENPHYGLRFAEEGQEEEKGEGTRSVTRWRGRDLSCRTPKGRKVSIPC